MSTDVQVVDTGLDKQSRRRSKDTEKAHRRSSNFQNKKYKHDHKFRKKIAANGKFFPPYKKRNKDFIIPPTKFLLGGNITDPLNLNSLQDEDINRAMNAVTPKSSPLPTPKHRKGEIEVIIPPDITDPLNLIAGDDDATYEAMLTSPVKKTAKKQKKNKKRRSHRSSSGPGSGKEDSIEGAKLDQTDPSPAKEEKTENQEESKKDVKTEEETKDVKETPQGPPPAKRHKSEHNNRASLRKIELKERKADLDKIVSPVIPQPGAWNDRHRFRPPQRTPQIDKSQAKEMPKFKESNAKFQYGNYCRYYGYRNPNQGSDVRFRVMEKHKHLFEGKDVLDIGCNTGHLTLAIARDFRPNRVVGMDIDRSLITAARSNIRHYVNCGKKDKFFPVSMPIVYGPIEIPGVYEEKGFPHNISFIQGNYVLESDVLLSLEQPQFDVILCLSITKWIQLNWGDAGLKRAFKRMFAQLRPGGVLILEAQSWSSYKRKRNLTPDTWKNYHAVELFPHHFTQYLLTEVGFSKCEVIGAPVHPSRGFQRPIKMFIKEDPSFDTPHPMGNNTERFESYSFRLPDSVHGPDDFSGDSNFPYETPNSFNSPESGFSEGLHPRRYHVMRYPIDEAVEGGGEGQGDGASTSGEWRPTSAEESTVLSADSSSQGEGAADETVTSQDGELEVSVLSQAGEPEGAVEQMETNELEKAEQPGASEPDGAIKQVEASGLEKAEQPGKSEPDGAIEQVEASGLEKDEQPGASEPDGAIEQVEESGLEKAEQPGKSEPDGAIEQVEESGLEKAEQPGKSEPDGAIEQVEESGLEKAEQPGKSEPDGAIEQVEESGLEKAEQPGKSEPDGAIKQVEESGLEKAEQPGKSEPDRAIKQVEASGLEKPEQPEVSEELQAGEPEGAAEQMKINKVEKAEQPKTSAPSEASGEKETEHQEAVDPGKVDKSEVKVSEDKTTAEASEIVQRCPNVRVDSDTEAQETKEKCSTTDKLVGNSQTLRDVEK